MPFQNSRIRPTKNTDSSWIWDKFTYDLTYLLTRPNLYFLKTTNLFLKKNNLSIIFIFFYPSSSILREASPRGHGCWWCWVAPPGSFWWCAVWPHLGRGGGCCGRVGCSRGGAHRVFCMGQDFESLYLVLVMMMMVMVYLVVAVAL